MNVPEPNAAAVMAPRVAVGLVVVAIVSLVAYFALSAYAPDFRDSNTGEAHALSKSAIGFAGLRVLMDESGIASTVDRGRGSAEGTPSLIVLTPPAYSDEGDLKKLATTDPDIAKLVILPKWEAVSDPSSFGRVLKATTYSEDALNRLTAALADKSKIARLPKAVAPDLVADPRFAPVAGPLAKVDTLQTISGPGWTPLLSLPNGSAVLAQLKGTSTYVLAEPDLMNTHGLNDLPTAALALSIVQRLRGGDAPVSFDVTLNGLGREPSLLRALFAPPFLGATLCAILAALLIAVHAAVRFGSPEPVAPVYARGKLALVSNAAEMIRLLKREPRMAPRYAQTTRNLVVRALGVRRQLGPQESEAVFKALESEGGSTYQALLAEAGSVNGRAGLVALAHKIFEWRERILHAR